MTRVTTTNYGADATTQFAWATTDADFFDREADLYRLAQAVEGHDHSSGRGLAVTRIAANSVGTTALQALSVTSAKLAAGAAVANVGYTPINKAGDTGIGALGLAGNITFNNTAVLQGKTTGGVDRWLIGLWTDNVVYIGSSSHATQVGGSTVTLNPTGACTVTADLTVNRAASPTIGRIVLGNNASLYIGYDGSNHVINGWKIWHEGNDGSGSGLDADTVDGQHLSQILAAAVPTGAVVWFRTSAELTAAGASWTTETSLSGRIPYGAGTTYGQTFTANTDTSTTNWTPVTGLTNGTVGASVNPTSGATAGGLNLDVLGHTHPGPTISGQGSAWFPPGRVGVFGRKI